MYNTNIFLEKLYKQIQPQNSLLNCGKDEFDAIKEERKAEFVKLLKIEELEKLFDKELSYEIEKNFESMEIQIDKYRLDAIEGLKFPVYHVKPEKPNGKTILYLHGHDDLGIMGALLERYDKVRYHKMIPLKLAKAGYDVYAPELIGHGEASFIGFPKGTDNVAGCVPIAHYLTLAGFSIGGFRVYQILKSLDFMQKKGIEKDITVFGISGGGMSAQHIITIDDRITSGIIACYPNTYTDSVLAKDHCVCNYVPGLLKFGDSAELLALAAPKKIFTVNGKSDKGFPKIGSESAFDFLSKVYNNIGCGENYTSMLIDGRHEIDENVIIDWLDKNI